LSGKRPGKIALSLERSTDIGKSGEVGAEKEPFSMADVKTFFNNKLQFDLFLTKFGKRPDKPKNKKGIRELRNYGARAA